MRYIRFLKTPRVVVDKKTAKSEVHCLITIASDLGDSFLPYDVQLSAELYACTKDPADDPEVTRYKTGDVLVWGSVQWTGGMRSLSITLPLRKSQASSFQLRVGVEPRKVHDDYASLSEPGARGVVSAWSAAFASQAEAPKLVERRFVLPTGKSINVWEETGESIARHLWDAGVALSCHLPDLLKTNGELGKRFPVDGFSRGLELGCGCGMVGLTLVNSLNGMDVSLTDLPEATDIANRNAWTWDPPSPRGPYISFDELDWDAELPQNLTFDDEIDDFQLLVAADCTYNPDSSPSLVNTMVRIAKKSPNVVVAIAMKMRHSSEEVFFDLMAKAGFEETGKVAIPLPGDEMVGEETVHLYVYKFAPG